MVSVWPYADRPLADALPHMARDEMLAVFFVHHAVRLVHALHTKHGLYHNAISAMCFTLKSPAVTSDGDNNAVWSSHFEVGGGNGWKERGLLLRSFEHATPSSHSNDDYRRLGRIVDALLLSQTSPAPTSASGARKWNEPLWLQIRAALHNADDGAKGEQAAEASIASMQAVLEAPDPARYRQSLKSLLTRMEIAMLSSSS